jgi:hypothetical protein
MTDIDDYLAMAPIVLITGLEDYSGMACCGV